MKKEYIAPAITEDYAIETEDFIAASRFSTDDAFTIELVDEEWDGEGA